jgi:hypothetical protein
MAHDNRFEAFFMAANILNTTLFSVPPIGCH